MTRSMYDVILVGGGVMGCATAYHLLRFDNRLRVALIEMDPTYGRASTTLSDGNMRVQFNIKENIQMSLYGRSMMIDPTQASASRATCLLSTRPATTRRGWGWRCSRAWAGR